MQPGFLPRSCASDGHHIVSTPVPKQRITYCVHVTQIADAVGRRAAKLAPGRPNKDRPDKRRQLRLR
jgi:hypothetical protein